jgi:hypothetical protein
MLEVRYNELSEAVDLTLLELALVSHFGVCYVGSMYGIYRFVSGYEDMTEQESLLNGYEEDYWKKVSSCKYK